MRELPHRQHLPPPSWSDRWWDPAKLLSDVSRHNARVQSSYIFFHRPELKPLREAYAAALFAVIRSQCQLCEVRMERDRFPDFRLRVPGETYPFELTEADRKGRRRTDEYRELEARAEKWLPQEWGQFDPDQRVVEILPVIKKRVREKADRYGPRPRPPLPHLLVYVNVPLFGPLPAIDHRAIAPHGRDRFASIWLLWGGNAVSCYPNAGKIVLREMPAGLV